METIELKDVMNQLPVADLVKNLAGVDKNGVPSQFTMENIAAVVGESILAAKRLYTTTDLNNVKDAGLVFAGEGVPNAPVPYVYVLTLVSDNPNDTIQIGFSIVSKNICIRAMSQEGWRPWRII